MFEVLRVENYTDKIIDRLGVMNEDDFINFSKKYVGDISKWGIVFENEEELLRDIDYIKRDGEELWSETKDANIMIKYIKKVD